MRGAMHPGRRPSEEKKKRLILHTREKASVCHSPSDRARMKNNFFLICPVLHIYFVVPVKRLNEYVFNISLYSTAASSSSSSIPDLQKYVR